MDSSNSVSMTGAQTLKFMKYRRTADKRMKELASKMNPHKPMQEDAGVAVNNVGGGAIAGVGIGQQGEPGVYKNKKRKLVMSDTLRRWMPKM